MNLTKRNASTHESTRCANTLYHHTIYSIFESAGINNLVLKVTAVDPDAGTNGQVTYQLVSDPSFPFRIDSSGNILVNGVLDYETVTVSFFSFFFSC
jgi:hypothetical protein